VSLFPRLLFALAIVADAVLLVGCGGGGGGGISADTSELQAVADEQAEYLRETFGVTDFNADLRTVASIDAEGRFRASDGHLYYGRTIYGFHNPARIEVSDRYFPGVVRHELLHAAGYSHGDQAINGVTVADHVGHWYD
jgi:hypothetical protein